VPSPVPKMVTQEPDLQSKGLKVRPLVTKSQYSLKRDIVRRQPVSDDLVEELGDLKNEFGYEFKNEVLRHY